MLKNNCTASWRRHITTRHIFLYSRYNLLKKEIAVSLLWCVMLSFDFCYFYYLLRAYHSTILTTAKNTIITRLLLLLPFRLLLPLPQPCLPRHGEHSHTSQKLLKIVPSTFPPPLQNASPSIKAFLHFWYYCWLASSSESERKLRRVKHWRQEKTLIQQLAAVVTMSLSFRGEKQLRFFFRKLHSTNQRTQQCIICVCVWEIRVRASKETRNLMHVH